ncbi:Glycogen debranching enzyme [Yarrowia sp. C11]|nr:Glycogen debranching enzyme [Yarrowia sp. E02]KAG5369861.1 Glycogen debranching enzyme [Yarrowia sp. C11]
MSYYVLPLNNNGVPRPLGKGSLISLPVPNPSYHLRLVVSSVSDISRNGKILTNVPKKGEDFDRSKYQAFEISSSFEKECYIDIPIHAPGAYSFYAEFETPRKDFFNASEESHATGRTDEYYFNVSSGYTLNGEPVPFSALTLISIISKWMGPYKTWDSKLQFIKDTGYNMIHFTPLQTRGESNSPYSIFDQLEFDKEIFPNGNSDVAELVDKMEKKYDMLAMIDIVLNHTANNTSWLQEHPEACYSVETAPHMESAIVLDDAIIEFSDGIGLVQDPGHLDEIMSNFKTVVTGLDLWQFYVVDVAKSVDAIADVWSSLSYIDNLPEWAHDLKGVAKYVTEEAVENAHVLGARYKKVDASKAAGIIATYLSKLESTDAKAFPVDMVKSEVKKVLDEVNDPFYKEFNADQATILDQVKNRVAYTRLDENGPQHGQEVSKKSPLVETYYTRVTTKDGKKLHLANNGWMWGANPLVDFASDKSKAYLLRQVIIWGDCVKLRYGQKPEDSPWLWEHMAKYVETCAKYFHGVRVDNCHSTPLVVGQYLLDKARKVRPNLFVVAELFTGSEDEDRIFVERLGITALIREAMQADNVAQLSTLVHKHGGRPIGSFFEQSLAHCSQDGVERVDVAGDRLDINLVRKSNVDALFMDCTHDNNPPAQKRTVEDTLPNAALVAMCACSVGSNMGYDQVYPKLLDVVGEDRAYNFDGGIAKVKAQLYSVHEELGRKHAEETFIHHDGQFITVHRLSPIDGHGYFLVARTKFDNNTPEQTIAPITLSGSKAEQVLAVKLVRTGDAEKSDKEIFGIPTKVEDLGAADIKFENNTTTITLPDFPAGSIALFKTNYVEVDKEMDKFVRSGAEEAVANFDLLDLNVVLYRAESEERDFSGGKDGVYDVPGYGKLTYAGIQGWVSPLISIVAENNLGHPLCEHLRNGNWAMTYTVDRLGKYEKEYPDVATFKKWLKSRFDRIASLPNFLHPRYFALIIYTAYAALRNKALSLLDSSISDSTIFVQNLALTSIQMIGKIPSASVYPDKVVASLAAGLPHFSVDYMRCWGRDVFISIRGLALCTGRYDIVKSHILGFAKTLKHGLIPNLLDSGRNPRYNARDATWFFLEAIQDYVKFAPDGAKILDEKVTRRFPLDDKYVPVDSPEAFQVSSSIREVIYEILARHAKGIEFREANAGPDIDSQMKSEGFNQKISVDWNNGLIFGGNQWNCGTWMDKMGESAKAENKGYPGTPRDGSAIEIAGLLKSSLRFVNELNKKGLFEWTEVENQDGNKVKFVDWEKKVQDSFEHCYWVPEEVSKDKDYDVDSSIVNRRGIYKDLYRSGKPYEDYQLRPNFAIAMSVAPELFTVDKALHALSVADKAIRGPVGMATLDPSDLNYRPYYLNSVDSDDFATSKGRNYHQGPEWVWNIGYFFRAFLHFGLAQFEHPSKEARDSVYQQLSARLEDHRKWIHESPWAGLTELTQKDGELCGDSSPTQAWSSSTLIDLVFDANLIEKK